MRLHVPTSRFRDIATDGLLLPGAMQQCGWVNPIADPSYAPRPRYAVHDSASDEELIRSFFDEALRLLDAPTDQLSTTMLIIPRYTGSIDEFYELYEWLTDTLEDPEEEVLNNQVRIRESDSESRLQEASRT